MGRNLALALTAAFLVAFLALTAASIADQGVTAGEVVAILVLALLGVGIAGALHHRGR